MQRPRLVAALAAQAAHCEGRSPLYAAVLKELQADAASASWVERLEDTWRHRDFAVGWEAAHLLLAGMHYAALTGEAGELAALYPSCGGRGGEPRGVARDFLARAGAPFWERLRDARVQTNEVGRSVAWMVAAAQAFGPRNLPFHLVELGTSAGLNLVGDYLPQRCRFVPEDARPPAGWNRRPHPVLTRSGLDLRPRNVAEEHDRLWLKACVWADDLPRLARLDRAIEVFLGMKQTPRLARCTFADAPDWLLENLRPAPLEGLLVFNSIGTVYLADEDYAGLRRGMARALSAWQGRGVWVEYERARGTAGGPLELALHRAAGGRLETNVMASGAPCPEQMRLHAIRGSTEGAFAVR
jgi:hypothetical protein